MPSISVKLPLILSPLCMASLAMLSLLSSIHFHVNAVISRIIIIFPLHHLHVLIDILLFISHNQLDVIIMQQAQMS